MVFAKLCIFTMILQGATALRLREEDAVRGAQGLLPAGGWKGSSKSPGYHCRVGEACVVERRGSHRGERVQRVQRDPLIDSRRSSWLLRGLLGPSARTEAAAAALAA